jgi:hypothetical protein
LILLVCGGRQKFADQSLYPVITAPAVFVKAAEYKPAIVNESNCHRLNQR